jgi:hypothetical protein
MKKIQFYSLAFLFMGIVIFNADAADKGPNFDSFRFVRSRNVFDPSRQPGRSTASVKESTDTNGDTYTLTGVLIHEAKAFAFFTGSKQSKVVALQDSIGGAKITSIQNSQVELDRNGKQVVVLVGKQVRVREDGTLEIPSAIITPQPESPAPTPISSAKPETDTAPSSSSDILKRMMEKRQQELSK